MGGVSMLGDLHVVGEEAGEEGEGLGQGGERQAGQDVDERGDKSGRGDEMVWEGGQNVDGGHELGCGARGESGDEVRQEGSVGDLSERVGRLQKGCKVTQEVWAGGMEVEGAVV